MRRTLIVAAAVLVVAAGCNIVASGVALEALRESADRVDIDVTYTVSQDEPDAEARPRKALVAIEFRVVTVGLGSPPSDSEAVDPSCFGALADVGASSRPLVRELVLSSSASTLTLREDVRIDQIPLQCLDPSFFDVEICGAGCNSPGKTAVELYLRTVVDDCSAYFSDTLLAQCAAEVESTTWQFAGTTSAAPA